MSQHDIIEWICHTAALHELRVRYDEHVMSPVEKPIDAVESKGIHLRVITYFGV